MKRRHTGAALAVLLVMTMTAAAYRAFGQVNEQELGNPGPVEFINYAGPYDRVDTLGQIWQIGYDLGLRIKAGAERAGEENRYNARAVRAPGTEPGLNADLFGLGVDVGVDHIRNLRLIVQGYLEGAYGYDKADAALLAQYITVYNAVYRGDLAYFATKYKPGVAGTLTRDRSGLSIRFDEWPGRALLLIPMGQPGAGPLNAVDTTVISDHRVVDQLREDAGLGLEARRDMVDLKERQAEAAVREAETRREAIREEEQAVAEERRTAETERQAAEAELAAVARERQTPGADQAALDQRQEAAEERREAAEEREAEAAEREAALDEAKGEVANVEQFAEDKAREAQDDRRDIAGDLQGLIDRGESPPPPEGLMALTILGQTAPLGRFVKLDPRNGSEIQRSPLLSVNIRTVVEVAGRLVAVAGQAQGSGAVRLVSLSRDTLETDAQGADDIDPNSLLWVRGADLYAIVSAEGGRYVARFDAGLVLKARSEIQVHPFAGVTFLDGYLATQRPDGGAALLDPQTLKGTP